MIDKNNTRTSGISKEQGGGQGTGEQHIGKSGRVCGTSLDVGERVARQKAIWTKLTS